MQITLELLLHAWILAYSKIRGTPMRGRDICGSARFPANAGRTGKLPNFVYVILVSANELTLWNTSRHVTRM